MSTLPIDAILEHLAEGTIHMEGYVPWGSNYTFIVTMTHNEQEMQAVYKPREGERPLWDFPTGTLCSREYAAYLISTWLGWDLVPPTILREGPQGWGSVQYFIDHDPEENFFTFRDDHVEPLKRVALFDLIINNADRKGGHVIVSDNGRLWAIDHGIAFHDEPKLRTVIWDYATQPIAEPDLQSLQDLSDELTNQGDLYSAINQLLSQREIDALHGRIQKMFDTKQFPEPGPGRPYPWPMV